MVLIVGKKKSERIDYDYWNEVQRSRISSRNDKENRKEITKQIAELLEKH